MLKQLTKAVFEAALDAGMVWHLGHARHDTIGNAAGNVRNVRNGHSAKSFGVNTDRRREAPGLWGARAIEPRLRLAHLH